MTKENLIKILYFLIVAALSALCVYLLFTREKGSLSNITATDIKSVTSYYDSQISTLKKENKSLYDSLKNIKNVESAIQYKYIKKYLIDTVWVDKDATGYLPLDSNTYTYENSLNNDTLHYKLSIGSITKPIWYKLQVNVYDKFTIINRRSGEINQTIINSENNGQITDVTAIHTSTNKNFWKRFTFGPQIGIGYGLVNKKFDTFVGIGGSFDILSH